mmetsp:Transcript_11793/g.28250  ORF Transcript_11793/g.28250 Transcript_11793/m.28250 type:complete len:417 (+) Transcript_11793:94-1344(+)
MFRPTLTKYVVRMTSSISSSSSFAYHPSSCYLTDVQSVSLSTVAATSSASGTSTESTSSSSQQGGGGGGPTRYGNVHDQMMTSPDLQFKYCSYPKTATIIGAPMTWGQPFVGTDSGPAMLRERGLLTNLTKLGWRVEDLNDLDFDNMTNPAGSSGGAGSSVYGSPMVDPPNARNCTMVGNAGRILADLVETKAREGRFPLMVGGDHSIGIGSLAGILRARPETGIIWVDAHADLNTPETSGSGNMHGMPLGLLLDQPIGEGGVDFSKLPGFDFLIDGPRFSPDQLVYIGLRDVDKPERDWIRKHDIKTFTMYDIDHLGIGKVMDEALDHLKDRPLHLSYDIDAVDPVLAPATGTKVRGGLTYREAHFIAECVAQSGNLGSADIVEVNPTLSCDDGADETVELGLQLITSFMGKTII